MLSEPEARTSCPQCGNSLCTLLFMGVQPDGYACLTCRRYYTDDLEPVELWRKLWATPQRQGQPVVFADYAEGIEHPSFWAMCRRCHTLHGPYNQLANIRSLCGSCDEEDLARLRAYREGHT